MTQSRHSHNFVIHPDTFTKLTELSDENQISRAACIRQLIHHAWSMKCQGVATCATGDVCPFPQMSRRRPTPNTIGEPSS